MHLCVWHGACETSPLEFSHSFMCVSDHTYKWVTHLYVYQFTHDTHVYVWHGSCETSRLKLSHSFISVSYHAMIYKWVTRLYMSCTKKMRHLFACVSCHTMMSNEWLVYEKYINESLVCMCIDESLVYMCTDESLVYMCMDESLVYICIISRTWRRHDMCNHSYWYVCH